MMEKLIIEATENSPKIILDPAENRFEISGSSFLTATDDFYSNVINWMGGFVQKPNTDMVFNFRMNYINSSSKKTFFKLFKLLEEVKTNLKITWYYEVGDEDLLEEGIIFSKYFKLNFEFIPFN
jgi:SiaC family regulatory phosphoprotein